MKDSIKIIRIALSVWLVSMIIIAGIAEIIHYQSLDN